MAPLTVFVCGVTGNQGGAAARHLTSNGAKVHSVSRDPSTPAAKAIAAMGVQLWRGDWADAEALGRALAGCTAVFLNLSPDMRDYSAELRTAQSIMALARSTGVEHIVYSGLLPYAGADTPEPPHWDPEGRIAQTLRGKQDIEAAIRTAGFATWTILRPGNFMANFVLPLARMTPGLVDRGRWQLAVAPGSVSMPLIDVDTIGRFACAAILDPSRFAGREITLVDELLTPEDVLRKLGRAAGRNLQGVYVPEEELDAELKTNPFLIVQLLLQNAARMVDMEEVRAWGVPLSSFDAFLEREKDRIVETYGHLA